MRRKGKIIILILLMAIGFATVTTTLMLNGNTIIGANKLDYEIFFSEAILDKVDKSNVIIGENRQEINFSTKELTSVDETSVLEYEVTNNSKQYDARVEVNCMVKDTAILEYINVTSFIEDKIIPARSKTNGRITVKLIKSYTGDKEFNNELKCTIETEAVEKNELVEDVVEKRIYYTYGFLVDEENKPIKNTIVGVYGKEGKFTVTDDRGMYIITGLASGEYDLLVFENITEDELSTKEKEEVISLATYKTTFDTKASNITLENDYLKYGSVIAGEPVINTITFDTNGGTSESFESKVIEGQGIGYLPETEHENLFFKEWQGDGNSLKEDTIVTGDVTIVANYGNGVARIGEKNFKTLNEAFAYITTNDLTTIEVLKNNSLTESINTDKNVIVNLNEKNVDFGDYNINNSGNLSINNGSINANGLNVLTNSGTLNLNENLSVEHVNTANESEYISAINNQSNLTVDNTNITTNYSNYVQDQAAIKDEGTSTISNSTITMRNTVVLSSENSNMTLNNVNIMGYFDVENDRIIQARGNLTINNGTYKITEDNQTSLGVFTVTPTGTLKINSGIIDNTYGKGTGVYNHPGGIINLGEENKDVTITGIGGGTYTISSYGTLNIPAGNIEAENGHFIGNFGVLNIGTDTTEPTMVGAAGYKVLAIRSSNDNIINNGNIIGQNGIVIDVYENAKLKIENANVSQSNSTITSRAIQISGELTINNGTYEILETNKTSSGMFILASTGTLTINSGIIDNTYGKGISIYNNSGGTLNLGKENKDITITGIGGGTYTILNYGTLNIPAGNIEAENGHFIGNMGVLKIGTDTTEPTIVGAAGYKVLAIRSSNDNIINNGNIIVQNGVVIDVYENAKLEIENANISQSNSTITNSAIDVSGELTINNGTYKITKDNQASVGVFTVTQTGTLTINSGTIDNAYGKENCIYNNSGGTLNLGEENKDVTITGIGGETYTIANYGTLNIPAGNIEAENGHFIGNMGVLKIGTEITGPTIVGADSYDILEIGSNNDNIINNGNFIGQNETVILVLENAKLKIENANVSQSNRTSTYQAIFTSGQLTINNGTYEILEGNEKASGLFNVTPTGTLTINSGTINNTHGLGYDIYAQSGSTLNLGKENENIKIIGNKSGYYMISSYGTLNIPAGNIEAENGHFIGNMGVLNIGTDTTEPTIVGAAGYKVLAIRSSKDNIINNGNIIGQNGIVIDVYENAKLKIENANVSQSNRTSTNRAINVSGDLTINNGNFTSISDNNSSYGIFNVYSGGTLNIEGGTFDYNGYNNSIYIHEDGTVNIGKNSKNEITITNLNDLNIPYPLIVNQGNINIYSGTIKTSASSILFQKKGKDGEEYTEEEKLNYAATTNIYGGYIENNSSASSTIHIDAGRLEMFDGEVVNKGTGRTIYNSGGTAIQKGGTSLKNHGVTIE